MLVADTEFLFALNPRDRKHQCAVRLLREVSNLWCLTSLPSSFKVLRARDRNPSQVKMALLAIHEALKEVMLEKPKP